MKRAVWGAVLGAGCALLVAACGAGAEDPDVPRGTESVRMRISLEGDACGVQSASAIVFGDFGSIGPTPLAVLDGYLEGIVENIPAGLRRVVDVRAYNARGMEVYAGSAPVDVYAGSVASAQLTLYRNPQYCPGLGTGSVYIIGTLEGTGPVDAGPAYDAGPSWDAGPAYDAGPGPEFDAGTAFDAG